MAILNIPLMREEYSRAGGAGWGLSRESRAQSEEAQFGEVAPVSGWIEREQPVGAHQGVCAHQEAGQVQSSLRGLSSSSSERILPDPFPQRIYVFSHSAKQR